MNKFAQSHLFQKLYIIWKIFPKQKIDSYDLKKINKDNFILIYKAISDKNNSKIKFLFSKK